VTSRTFISERPREVYQGRKLPWHFYAGLGAPFAVLVLVLYAAGVSLGGEIMALAFGYCAIASWAYLGSRFRNCVALDPDRITISVWVGVPGGTHHIAYDRITRVEADDASDTLSLWFEDDAGDSGAIGITLSQPSSASKVRDAILLRQSSLGVDHDESEAADANAVSPAEIVPELPGEKHRLRVETPAWMKWGVATVSFIGVFAAVIEGGGISISMRGVAGLAAFMFVMTLIFAAIEKLQTYLILHPDRVDMWYALGDKHRIKYADVIDAEGSESGWLVVTYTKKATLGLGGGETEAQIRIKRHSLAPVVADAIKLGRDRAKHAGQQTPA
jgi:hypothetical protein